MIMFLLLFLEQNILDLFLQLIIEGQAFLDVSADEWLERFYKFFNIFNFLVQKVKLIFGPFIDYVLWIHSVNLVIDEKAF